MGRFTQLAIAPIVGLFILSISGCNTAQTSLSTKYKPSPYKRIVQVSSNHDSLKKAVEMKAARNSNFIVKTKDDFSEFRVVLNTTIKRINSLETKPLLMGRLQKTMTPVNLKAEYKLTNTSKHILASGMVDELTESTATIYPKINVSNNINEATLNSVAEKIVNEVNSHVKATPWSTTVIGQKDDQHVTVSAGKDVGLTPGVILITESQPVAKLQVAAFEKTASGRSRAVLLLMEGFLPSTGRRLIPEK